VRQLVKRSDRPRGRRGLCEVPSHDFGNERPVSAQSTTPLFQGPAGWLCAGGVIASVIRNATIETEADSESPACLRFSLELTRFRRRVLLDLLLPIDDNHPWRLTLTDRQGLITLREVLQWFSFRQ
jgi:hypothetical protein